MRRQAAIAGVLAAGAIGAIVAVRLLVGDGDEDAASLPSTREPSSVATEGTKVTSGTPAPVSRPAVPAPPALEGRVVDARTEEPLAGLTFRVRLARGTRTDTRQVTADEEGGFELAGIPDGEYRVTFEHPRFFPVETDVSLGGQEGGPARLEVVFERGVTVRGSVSAVGRGPVRDAPYGAVDAPVDAPVDAIVDAIVEWVAVDDPAFVREAVCTPEGTYELGGLEPGRYWVRVMPRQLAALWRGARPEEVRLDDVPEVIRNLEASLGASLVVRVTRDGVPLAGVAVRFEIQSQGRGIAGFLELTDTVGATPLHGLPRTGTLKLEVPAGPQGAAAREVDLKSLPRSVTLELEG